MESKTLEKPNSCGLDFLNGQSDYEQSIPLRNNDPLAHVNLLLKEGVNHYTNHRIKVEFITDMGERLENQPFHSSFNYTFDGNEIVYDTGILYLKSLEKSYQAALKDISDGTFNEYHARRQRAFYEQGSIIKSWLADDENKSHLLLLSLCPSDEELSSTEAKKQGFKPDRKMASNQLHTKNSDGTVTTTTFSLDNLTLASLQSLFDELDINASASKSTLDQLLEPLYINSEYGAELAASTIIDTHDSLLHRENQGKTFKQGIDTSRNIVEANSFVSSHPEVYKLYQQVIVEVAESLSKREVTNGLEMIVSNRLSSAYKDQTSVPKILQLKTGGIFTEWMASGLVDYIRQRAIPEYLTNILEQSRSINKQTTLDRSSYIDIGSAGAQAIASGRSYDGACPSSSSGSVMTTATSSLSKQAQELGLQQINTINQKIIWKKGRCVVPNCPSLRKNKDIDVGQCSVCRDCQKKYDKGIDPVEEYKPKLYDYFLQFAAELLNSLFSDPSKEKSFKKTSNNRDDKN